MGIASRLLQRLDDLGQVLQRRGDAVALIGVGSVGQEVSRLDDHSDMDFFVVVDDSAKSRYLTSVDWLEELEPVIFSFANTGDGRKALFADGLFAEYAVFTLAELRHAAYSGARVVWRRPDAPPDLDSPAAPVVQGFADPAFHVNEALTNLYVGLHRELRGEHLSANRFIQVYAVDQVLACLDARELGRTPRQDVFAVERGIETRYDAEMLPLATMVPGYRDNRRAALAILDLLESPPTADLVHRAMALAIRDLAS